MAEFDNPRPPAHIAPYVEVLGVDLTVKFLMTFGGGELYYPARPRPTSRLVKLVGMEKALKLHDISYRLTREVPLAKPWLAAVMLQRGTTKNEIAQTLHTSVNTVRGWLNG